MTAASSGKAESVYLVDASIHIFQSHFSPYVEYFDRHGNELSAVYGFTQFLLQFLRRVKPGYVAVAHDESLFCGFRHEICPDYKSNRELPDENLAMQLAACFEIGDILGLASFASTTYEADDIIGTLSSDLRRESDDPIAIEIVSRDKDLAQLLITEHDCLWDYSGNRKRYRKDIHADYGIHPEQFPDYLGLVGDSVDCISGVPGVGPVKAQELLRQFETMEGIYNNLEKVPGLSLRGARRLAELLDEHRELAELSKRLATIVCDVKEASESFTGTDMKIAARDKVDLDRLKDFLSRYQFGDDEVRRIVSNAESLQL